MEDDDKYEADDSNDRGDPRFCIRRRRVKLCQEGDGNAPVLTVETAFYSLSDPT